MVGPINPKIITWARERNHLSVEGLAALLKKDPSVIQQWEDGVKEPSYSALEALAYRHLKIPLALFFFPEPPSIEDPVNKFRRLPDYEFNRISLDTMQKIRLVQGYQESLEELAIGGIPRRKIFRDISPKGKTTIDLAGETRNYLGITFKNQIRFRSSEEAFKAWRFCLEEVGIFSFKDSLEDKFISGFCLLHDNFPVIFINNSNAFSRQTFTLIHELGHILFGRYGVTDINEKYLEYMNEKDKTIEVKCNKFASEVLVPEEHFEKDIKLFLSDGPEVIPDIAQKYGVSKEVILRRLLDKNLVTENYYKERAEEWNQEYLRSNTKAGGGNYYLTKLSYLGSGFTQLAFENYNQGRLTKAELASHLNLNSKNLGKLQSYVEA